MTKGLLCQVPVPCEEVLRERVGWCVWARRDQPRGVALFLDLMAIFTCRGSLSPGRLMLMHRPSDHLIAAHSRCLFDHLTLKLIGCFEAYTRTPLTKFIQVLSFNMWSKMVQTSHVVVYPNVSQQRNLCLDGLSPM